MATVRIEGRQTKLPDEIVKAGDRAIRAALAPSYPAIESAHIVIAERKGHPTVVRVSLRPSGMNEKYKETVEELRRELDGATAQHAQLEKRIAKLRAAITSFEQLNESDGFGEETQTLLGASRSAVAGKAMGLTDSIRQVLKAANRPLLVREVKEALIARGYDVKRYQNISGAIPIVLKRLREQGEADIELQKIGNKKILGYVYIPSEEQVIKPVKRQSAKR